GDGYQRQCLARDGVFVEADGGVVQEAKKQPLTEESVKKQFYKTGNTPFYIEELALQLSEDAFLPVKSLNDLRRKAFDMLEGEIIKKNGFAPLGMGYKTRDDRVRELITPKHQKKAAEIPKLHVLALTREQYNAALKCGVERIYVNADICMDGKWLEDFFWHDGQTECYLAMPYIIRGKDSIYLDKIKTMLQNPAISGGLVRNLEELQFMEGHIVSDAGLYIWNKEAKNTLKEICEESYLPYELNGHEIGELAAGEQGLSMIVYGRIPMMVSSNCVAKTACQCYMEAFQGEKSGTENKQGERLKIKNFQSQVCACAGTNLTSAKSCAEMESKTEGQFKTLTDRYGKNFPVWLNCRHCYNVIYNSLPLSLHQHMDAVMQMGVSALRLDFTVENGKETEKTIAFWQGLLKEPNKASAIPPYKEYTNGHWKRGVE
ncbi:MAG: DUF3656 domain-containing protein, partial [Kineothrix sp.]|nr:DUF3656 domain-containing protein [Kineothrix sp.]